MTDQEVPIQKASLLEMKNMEVHEDEAKKRISKTESVQQQQSVVLVLNTI